MSLPNFSYLLEIAQTLWTQDPVSGLGPGDLLGRDELLAGLEAANSLAGERLTLEAALAAVNSALERGGPRELLTALQHPALRLAGLLVLQASLLLPPRHGRPGPGLISLAGDSGSAAVRERGEVCGMLRFPHLLLLRFLL